MSNTTTWELDPAHTTVEFAVKHMMFTTVRGRFKTFFGTVYVDEASPGKSRVEVEIDALEPRYRCGGPRCASALRRFPRRRTPPEDPVSQHQRERRAPQAGGPFSCER